MRECFDQLPENTEKTVPDKKRSAQEEEQDALRSYFREMGEMPQLSAEEELDLWKQIDENISQLREAVYQFAFVYDEHLKLLADPETDFADIFPASSRDNAPLPDNPVSRKEWSARISAAIGQMRTVYGVVSRDEFARLRADGFAILIRHPAVLEKLLEWMDVIDRYLDNFNAERLSAADLQDGGAAPGNRPMETPDARDQSAPRHQHCETLSAQGASVRRPDPGGKPRTHERA